MALFLPNALLALFVSPSSDREIGNSSHEQDSMSLSPVLAHSSQESLPQGAQSNTTKFSLRNPRRRSCGCGLLQSSPSMPAGNTEEKDFHDKVGEGNHQTGGKQRSFQGWEYWQILRITWMTPGSKRLRFVQGKMQRFRV